MLPRDHELLLPEPENYSKCLYDLFKSIAEALRNKAEWRKCKKSKSIRKRDKKKVAFSGNLNHNNLPEIELSCNASAFAVFASVRSTILEKHAGVTNEVYRASNCNSPLPPELSDTIDTESDDEDKISTIQSLPKIVGIGIRSVFTLMKESRTIEPILCTKALSALLDILQGQLPEGLKYEPDEVIDPLFDLLLDLATSHGPESAAANDGSHLTAVACACLLSLVVVRGDAGRLLSGVAALLMSPRALAIQKIQMPYVLTSLQRSVHAVLLGKLARPDWITYGVPKSSKVYSFMLKLTTEMNNVVLNGKSFVSNGKYLYLHTNKGLLKIGSGYGGTIMGHIYMQKADFYPTETGWLGYASNCLYFKYAPRKQSELLIIDAESLVVTGTAVLEGRDWLSSVMFSDGDNLGMITSDKDDGFVVRTINTLSNPVSVATELPLKLARKCVDTFGYPPFEEGQAVHTLNPGCDEELAMVAAGKEFRLIKTVSGKILYSGKGTCLGMKNNTRPNKWMELTLGKRPRPLHLAVGHEGHHIVLVMEDGSVLFAGTATRGEDGDSSKVRRQAKPVKPKKITKVEGQFIVEAACNNGSTALVTKEGSLIMFGKDTLHSDPITGVVSDLRDVCVVNVALGKAHAAALTNKGHLYTFGINNKGQCGRDFVTVHTISKDTGVIAMDMATGEDELTITEEEPFEEWDESRAMCPGGQHQWRDSECMVCTVCKECTGYSISCLSIKPDRNPGRECGCGEGDSGCAQCGCCRACAGKGATNGRSGSNLREYLQRRLGEIKHRQRIKSDPSVVKYSIKLKGAISQRSGLPNIIQEIPRCKVPSGVGNSLSGEEFIGANDVERSDATRIASIPPARVHLPSESPVIQVACGLHHTVVLLQNGDVYTFGSNVYGQLGVGDLQAHAGLVQVKLPSVAVQVAAGSNHTVVLTSKGEVYIFGAYQKGQLGLNWWNCQTDSSNTSQTSHHSERSQTWHSFPNLVPNVGPRWGRRATWIGASGDQTYIKIDEINSINLTKSTVMANKNCIILLPHKNDVANSFKCLVINKRDGSYNSYSGADQVDFSYSAACLDPLYNVIWTFNPENNEISLYNVIPMQAKRIFGSDASIFRPDLTLPMVSNCFVTRFQAAMHLLACLDTLTQAQDANITKVEENESNQSMHKKIYSREDFATVSRFESHGGGWGYSAHSVEAIRFMPDTDILLGGYGLFGGRGEYIAKIKLFDIDMDGGDQETDGELIAESEEIPYECGQRQKYAILFDEPVPLQANRWYVAWAKVSGPSSDCGSGGQGVIRADDQVVFYFKSSKQSNNGTDVNAGQIPQLLYRIITQENQTPNRQRDPIEPVYILKREFSRAVTKESFQSLISLLQWSWNTVKAGLTDTAAPAPSLAHALLEMESLVYISRASLRLLRVYTNEIYPNQAGKRTPPESVRLAECVGEVRALLCQILSDSVATNVKTKGKTRSMKSLGAYNSKKTNGILDECHKTFVSCYHAFYPTAYLKWTSLCELLSEVDRDEGTISKDRLLSAVLASLCNPTIRLRNTFPILSNTMDNSDSIKRQLSISNNAGLLMINSAENHQYPILVEQISYKTQMENAGKEVLNWSFRKVLDRLLDLILIPVKKKLCREKCQSLPELVLHCCYLLARVIADSVGQSSGNEDEIQAACGRLLYTTPSRFTRMTETRSWNTGNGSPDAICFSVDRPGIAIAGVGIYGGAGGYEYELELLDDTNTANDPSHTQRWSTLDCTRGAFAAEDCVNDIVELKFDKPVPIKENVKYALRLRNHGGRTSNGDGGLSIVKGPDGTTFSFTSCSLSFNGTTLTRGQIPHILYYSNPQDSNGPDISRAMAEVQAGKCTLAMITTIIQRSNEILALAREKAEEIVPTEIFGNATFVTTLLPLVMAHISPLATSDPRSGVQVLTLIQEMLPHVTALSLLSPVGGSQISQDGEIQTHPSSPTTTSHHYTWLESDHPYKSATISHYKVTFPETVKWLTVEFTPECGTAQPEDYLQLYIPNRYSGLPGWSSKNRDDSPSYWPVLHKLSNVQSQWPQNAIVLPGNEVVFSLETATDYMKNEKAITYGFKCLVIGYDWITSGNGLKNLEIELSFLGGACAAGLMKKNLVLPPVSSEEVEEDVEATNETAKRIFAVHSALLGRGFALASPPTITQAIDDVLPFSCQSNERLFLRDFVSCSPGTSGGRLARWLQPDSFVDPLKCEAIYSQDEMRCGRPTIVTILTRDQYGEIVHVPTLKIEVSAVPIDKKDLADGEQGKKVRRVFQPDPMTFGGHPYPSLDVPYEVSVHNNMCFYSITMMKAYENYSFDELRLMSPAMRRPNESMLVRPNGDGSYSATWTPSSSGWYSLMITVDGYKMEDNYKVEVKMPPQGIPQNIVKKSMNPPRRLGKFVAKNSAGLRIRAYPSLQSEQIGIVPVNGIVTFIEEIHNDDGVWVRLHTDTIKEYCISNHWEAWSLQYNQHLRKTLLVPVDEVISTVEPTPKDTIIHKKADPVEDKRKAVTFDGSRTMVVVKCGASGHNIRNRPTVKSISVGMLTLGNIVTAQEYFVNNEGIWVRIDEESATKYCFDRSRVTDGEAWSLAANKHGVTYMKIEPDLETDSLEKKSMTSDPSVSPSSKGFDFAVPSVSHEGFNFTTQNYTPNTAETGESSNTNPFVFGSHNQHDSSWSEKAACDKTTAPSKSSKSQSKEKSGKEKESSGNRFSILQKWLRDSDKYVSDKRSSPSRDFAEFAGVSVKELIKAIGESRANGNSTTPPETPRKTSTSSSPKNSQGGSSRYQTPSSSPVPIPAGSSRQPVGSGNCLFPPAANAPGGRSLIGGGDSISSSPVLCGSPRSVGLSPLVSGGMADSITSQRRGSTQSDTSALVSSLTRDPSQSPSVISTSVNTRDPSPSPSCSSFHMRSEGPLDGSPPGTPKKDIEDVQDQSRKVCQAQTQTSPENVTTAAKTHFTIGSSNGKEERHSSSSRVKRVMSPINSQQVPNKNRTLNMTKDKVKEAISASVAESLRAVFAAFLWHEGIVHDAMACASFLKFHPSLPKEGALVVTRQTVVQSEDKEKQEQKARQRHSVEVTNAGNYLHIQPSTLETLTRSAANANANRNRKKQETTMKEKTQTTSNKLGRLPEFHTVAVLPPALKSLVFLWEELSSNCLQAIEEQSVLSSPISQSQPRSQSLSQTQSQTTKAMKRSTSETRHKEDKVKDRDKRSSRNRMEWKLVNKRNAAEVSGGIERETTCELCGLMFPHPITYHMKMMHPGCGWHAGGKGYNSGGHYHVGWAGNCGDGGVGDRSWYLLCDTCRDKYLSARRIKLAKKFLTEMSKRKNDSSKISSPLSSPTGNEIHMIMKNNAMFLLDLASASGLNIPKQQRRPSQTLSSVAENYSPPETSNPFPPTGPFQCLQAFDIHHSQSHDERYYEEALLRQNGQQPYEGNGNTLDSPNGRPLSEHPMGSSVGESSKSRGVFHRSVSMSTGGPWTKNNNDGKVVTMRKRNNSSSETNNDTGSSLLCYPSAALKKLVPSMDQSAIVSTSQTEAINNDRIEILMRPVMLFVLEQHNLRHLQFAMKQALRRAACRVYAMQAFNWLLRTVTQPICLHDLLWWFVASLTPVMSSETSDAGEGDNREKKEDQDLTGVCEHPLSDLAIAGETVNPLSTVFHTLLQTIADLMLLPPPGSPLQQAAIRCWGIRFTPADHMFLHRSHVFSNISKILSRSDEEEDVTMSMHESHLSTHSQQNCSVEVLKDITNSAVLQASSRQAMVGSLIDNSTETFWESGDEDRNKTKTITITCSDPRQLRMIYIHIDNCRDLTHKVSFVTFLSGVSVDEMIELRTVEIESRSAGWISCPIGDSCHSVVGLEMKGPDNSLRVRQIKLLGIGEGSSGKAEKQLSAQTIQQRNCEAETLKVFRLITSQVFGKLIQGEQRQKQMEPAEGTTEDAEDSNDLREHMVGILFSRSNLTHLQKQVCTHIVQAIRKEAIRLREEWETLLCSPTPANSLLSDTSDVSKAADTYCFEMLSMVLALSGSSVGRHYLSHQYGLLKDLLTLLHTGSARVQRQVTSLLKRILPDIKPEVLANIVNVDKLPPTDFSIVSAASNGSPHSVNFDEHSPGLLDVFLSCIAKALIVQVKVKGRENGKAPQTVTLATSNFPKDHEGSRWWLRGSMSRKLAEVMIQLLKDMASGNLSEAWASVTKAAIAENILNLTRLNEKSRNPTECLGTATLWLALSSLCVLDSDHVERLSSGQWSGSEGQPPPPRPTCSNHDDGKTTAIIQCNVCGTLCAECDRILHLHGRTKPHIRQVCKEEEEAIRVDLHEGCGRMKLFWVLALADSTTLKALVEFRDGVSGKLIGATSGICRFCGITENSGLLAIGNVCSDHDCQEHGKNACNKVHVCGHICGGVRNEETCLPCLHRCLPGNNLKQDADDMCMICFTEALSAAPAIQLKCGHVFHLHCCRHVLMKRWVGPRITFGFSMCPICKVPMEHSTLADLLISIKELYEDVKKKALMRLEYEGLRKTETSLGPAGQYHQDPAAYAMDRYAYYVCYKCQKAYYGGEARCDAQVGGESFDPTELVCGGCSDVARAQMCPKHGADFLEYKCRYCCSVAVFFCFGTTHFCNPCHDNFQRVTDIPKNELPLCPAGPKGKQLEGDECPLHVKHPPTGEEFALGCGICRNAHTF